MYFQRFTVDDQGELRRQIEQAQSELAGARERGDEAQAVDIAAGLGSMLTTARREQEAHSLLLHSLASARQLGAPEPAGWLLLALATANQYLDRRPEANEQFSEALALARSSGAERLEHFVQHHWGRCLVEDGDVEGARGCFASALELRVKLNDPRQASSLRALEALKDKSQ